MKIKIELYGASKDFSSENSIELDLKNNSLTKKIKLEQLRKQTI